MLKKLNAALIRKAARAGQKAVTAAAQRLIARRFGWDDEAREHVMMNGEPMTKETAHRAARQADSEA